MAKTNKELSVEILCSLIDSWNRDGIAPITVDVLPEMLGEIYDAVSSLDSKDSTEN